MKTTVTSKHPSKAAEKRLQSARRTYAQIKKTIDSVVKKPAVRIYTPVGRWGETTNLLDNNFE